MESRAVDLLDSDLGIAIEIGRGGPGRCVRDKRTLVWRKMKSEAEKPEVL